MKTLRLGQAKVSAWRGWPKGVSTGIIPGLPLRARYRQHLLPYPHHRVQQAGNCTHDTSGELVLDDTARLQAVRHTISSPAPKNLPPAGSTKIINSSARSRAPDLRNSS